MPKNKNRFEVDLFKPKEVYDKKFTIVKKLDEGSYVQVYKALDSRTHKVVILKCEIDRKNNYSDLENRILEKLQSRNKGNFPKVISYKVCKPKKCSVIVMTYQGWTLKDSCKQAIDSNITVSCIRKIGIQLIKNIRALHKSGYLHGDLKPSNVCCEFDIESMKKSDSITEKPKFIRNSTVSIIDFGLCKKIKRKESQKPKEDDSYSGNLAYCSLNTCKGITKSRRDDIQSIVFIILWMCCKCNLPWNSAQYDAIGKRGQQTRKELYNSAYIVRKKILKDQIEHSKKSNKSSSRLPDFMIQLINEFCLKEVGFHDKPDYDKFLSILRQLKQKSTKKTTSSVSNTMNTNHKSKTSNKEESHQKKIKNQSKNQIKKELKKSETTNTNERHHKKKKH